MTDFVIEEADGFSLDQLSTSPTHFQTCAESFCIFNAPYFAVQTGGGRWSVVQGCCNHWECPKCGLQVAKKHYGRIVEGIRKLAEKHEIWFITITCRGGDLTEQDATLNYLSWTSKFLDACYAQAKRKGKAWHYVQVTEKQKRGHPHSHILTTFRPNDVYLGHVEKWETLPSGKREMRRELALRSDWMAGQVVKSGLGDQYDLSKVETPEAASRYVAKYMFKKAQFEAHYPKRWKRVRYSQEFPDREIKSGNAFVLLSREDWYHLASLALVIDATEGEEFQTATHFLSGHDVLIHEKKRKQNVSQTGNHRAHGQNQSVH